VITVELGKSFEDEIEVVEGMSFNQGHLSPSFITDKKTQSCEFQNAAFLLVDHKITSARSLIPILEQIHSQGKPLVIISADGMESEVLTTLVINKLQGLKVCAVKAPGFGDNRTAQLQDIAILTGAEIVSQDLGMKLEDVKLKQLGSAKSVSVNADNTLVLGGGGSQAEIEERCQMIRDKIASTTSEYEKEKAQERLAKLSGGVAQIKVGGASEVEVNEKKDRVVDALNATRAAISEGIVPGGGAALLYASLALEKIQGDNFDQNVGIKILKRAILQPARQIADNAGVEGAVIVSRLLEPHDGKINKNLGYNAQTGQFVDMYAAGILDPTKVVRTALIDAASVAGLMTTSQCLITDEEEEKPSAGMGGMGGGMGGMGGMGGGMF